MSIREALTSLTTPAMDCAATGLRPRDISSISRSLGRDINALPMASICCSPPERVPALCPDRAFNTGKTSHTQSSVSRRVFLAVFTEAPTSRFSRMLMRGKSLLPSGTMQIPFSTILWGGKPVNTGAV